MRRDDPLGHDEIILARATKAAVQAAGGLARCSDETGLSTSQLSRCESRDHHDSITVRDAVIVDALGHGRGGPHILKAMARIGRFVVIQLSEGPEDEAGLMQSAIDLTAELGDVVGAIRDALRDGSDGSAAVTPAEAAVALNELDEMFAVGARLRAKLEPLTRPPERRMSAVA